MAKQENDAHEAREMTRTDASNAEALKRFADFCRRGSLWLPVICTPYEMSGDEGEVSPVTTREALHGLPTPTVRPDIYDDEAEVEGPANHFAMRHSKRVMDKIAAIPPGTGPMSYRRLHPTKPANTLFSGHRAPPVHFDEPRSITVREAARLQGFPDTFRVYGSFANQMKRHPRIVRQSTMAALISGRAYTYRLKSNGTPSRADITGYQAARFPWLTNTD